MTTLVDLEEREYEALETLLEDMDWLSLSTAIQSKWKVEEFIKGYQVNEILADEIRLETDSWFLDIEKFDRAFRERRMNVIRDSYEDENKTVEDHRELFSFRRRDYTRLLQERKNYLVQLTSRIEKKLATTKC